MGSEGNSILVLFKYLVLEGVLSIRGMDCLLPCDHLMQLLVRWTAFCEVGLKSLQTVLHWLVWLWFLSQTSSGDVCIEKKSCSELITPCFCSCKSSIKIILLSVVRVPFVFTVQAWMWSHCYILEKDFNLRWGICSNWLSFWGLERNTDLWISRLPFSVGANALATHFLYVVEDEFRIL